MTENPIRIAFAISTIGLFSALIGSQGAAASGYLPLPEQREQLRNHRACLNRLHAQEASDKAEITPTVTAADGSERKVVLDPPGKGVVIINRQTARYEARIWYVNGHPRPDLGQMEYQSSWKQIQMECKGRLLIVKPSSGYTLSSFEPLPAKP